jgi:di/tricarboxylate transporter
MTTEIGIVYAIILAALILFASDRLRLDVVALMALLALLLTGIITVGEGLAGFADPIVLMIAGLFVVGDGLFQTGVAANIARIPARVAGKSDVKLIAAIMLIVALLSAFISSTGTVAVMLPVVMGLAWERGIAPSKLLIPVAVASLLGGMLTLIGTAPNIVVSNQLAEAGREPFGFFAFTPIGLVMITVGVGFMMLIGRHLLPERTGGRPPQGGSTTVTELAVEYRLPQTLTQVRVHANTPLVGCRLDQAALRSRYGVTVVDIRPGKMEGNGNSLRERLPGRTPSSPDPRPVLPETRIEAGDILILQGEPEATSALIAEERLVPVGSGDADRKLPEDVGLVEVILTPRSSLIGHTVREVGFREKYRATVLGVRRVGKTVEAEPGNVVLRFGDTLLVKGPWTHIRRLQSEQRDFVVASRPREMDDSHRPYRKAPLAGVIMLGMLVLMTTGVVDPVTAVLLAAVGMVLAGCVGVEDAYRSIHWESVVLIAAVLPMATALEKTGGLALIVDGINAALGGQGFLVILGALFILTSALSQVISNTATAVLLAPIAIQMATRVGAAPEPFLMAIAVAASTAFMTPIASPVNVLVLGPGGYRFSDFFRVGALLQIVILIATLIVVPFFFPFEL